MNEGFISLHVFIHCVSYITFHLQYIDLVVSAVATSLQSVLGFFCLMVLDGKVNAWNGKHTQNVYSSTVIHSPQT